METRYIDVDAVPGERWFPKETTFEEDINEYWGDWGVSSEVDTLKAVLMRRPGKEVEKFNAEEVRFSNEPIDVELMRFQHDAVADIYRQHGVRVYYVEEQRTDRPQCNLLPGFDVYDTGRSNYNQTGDGGTKRRGAVCGTNSGKTGGPHFKNYCWRRIV